MRTTTKVLTVAATLVLALSLAAPLQANCGTLAQIRNSDEAGLFSHIVNPQFQNFAAISYPGYYYVGNYGPANFVCTAACGGTQVDPLPPLSGAAEVSFWRTGTGDTTDGLGDDNGAYDMIASGGISWYASASVTRGATMFGTWNPAAVVDGCVGGNSCMCLLVTDQDGADGSWALLGGQSNASFNTDMSIGGTDGAANLAPIKMVNQAAPSIGASARHPASFDVDLSVSVPAQPGGVYTQDGCACGPVGFRVLQQIVGRGDSPPSDRSRSAWSEPPLAGLTVNDASPGAQGVTALGSSVNIRSLCGASNQDVYLTAELVFDSGFATTHVSGNSTRVECGPNLADPDDKPTPVRPRSGRPSPRKR